MQDKSERREVKPGHDTCFHCTLPRALVEAELSWPHVGGLSAAQTFLTCVTTDGTHALTLASPQVPHLI